MAWFGWSGRGGWRGPWPGRGPFSYLPPWQRPGWLFGRGACWWLLGYPWWAYGAPYSYGYPGFYGAPYGYGMPYTGWGAYRPPLGYYPYGWW